MNEVAESPVDVWDTVYVNTTHRTFPWENHPFDTPSVEVVATTGQGNGPIQDIVTDHTQWRVPPPWTLHCNDGNKASPLPLISKKNDQMCEKKSSQIVSMALTNKLKNTLRSAGGLSDNNIKDLERLRSHNLFKNNYHIAPHLITKDSIKRNIEKLHLANEWMKLFKFEEPKNVLNMVNFPVPDRNEFANKPTIKHDFIINNLPLLTKNPKNLTGRIKDHITHHNPSSHSSSTKSKSQKSRDGPKSQKSQPKSESKRSRNEPTKSQKSNKIELKPYNPINFIGTSPISPIPQQPPKTPDNVNKLCQCISNNGGMWDTKTQTFCTNKKIIERSLRRVKDRKVSLIPVDKSGRRIKKIYKNKLTKREREIIELLNKLQLV